MISILLADDHRLVRAGIKMLINNESDMQVLYEADHVEEMIRLVLEKQPDVIIVNLHVSKIKILNAIEKINKNNSKIKMIILSTCESEKCALQLLQAGASSFLLKTRDADLQLLEAIRTVYCGKVYFRPKSSSLQRDEIASQMSLLWDRTLTPREEEVLTNIALGYTNQEIADELFLSVKTIETHRAKIMEKLKLKSRSELVEYAIKNGYLDFVYEHFY